MQIVVMDNLVRSKRHLISVFDIKGSEKDRCVSGKSKSLTVEQLKSSVVYKDIDFDKVVGSIPLPTPECQRVVETLQADAAILNEIGVMDYSLIIVMMHWMDVAFPGGFQDPHVILDHPFVYSVGIIDFFQKWDARKKFERFGK
jgi:hypothetical protein